MIRTTHIVTIHQRGEINGYQLRVDGGGAGNSKFFASLKYGGPHAALEAAHAFIKERGLPPPTGVRGGSETGRTNKLTRTGVAGIRFVWVPSTFGPPILRVYATWTDKTGRLRSTSYSVEKNGMSGALDKAIAARTSAGAPLPSKRALLAMLRREFETGSA